MGRGGTSAREISFVSLVAYGSNSDSALTMGAGVTASETRQGGSQHELLVGLLEILEQLLSTCVNYKAY